MTKNCSKTNAIQGQFTTMQSGAHQSWYPLDYSMVDKAWKGVNFYKQLLLKTLFDLGIENLGRQKSF